MTEPSDATPAPASAAGARGEIHGNAFQGPAPIHTGSGSQINNFTVALPEQRARVLAGLPPEPAGFVGREGESTALLAALNPGAQDAGAVVICAVAGLAGVGKSALAVHAARRAVAEGWFHGAVFLNLRGYDPQNAPVNAGDAVTVLLRALGVNTHLPATADERLALYQAALTQLAAVGRRVLLVLDNVADAGQADALLPGNAAHRVLVTSRQSLASLSARLLDLDVLSGTEAVQLLTQALRNARPDDPRAAEDSALAALAAACGGLPLALQIAAALLKASPRRAVSDLAKDLADERARLKLLAFPDNALRPGVRAALKLSCDRLTEPQARMLRLLTVDPGPDVETPAAAALADLSPAQASGLLYALEGAHLIKPDASGRRWGMHDLVRLYGRELLDAAADSAEQQQARDRLFAYYLTTAEAADGHLRALPGESASARFGGRDEALAWFDANRANLVAAVDLAVERGRLDVAALLPLCMTEFFFWRVYLQECVDTHVVAVNAARSINDRRHEGTALTNLGTALQELRRFDEAIEAHQQAVAVYREAADKHSEGSALNNLGMVLSEVNRFDAAVEAHRQAAAIFRETGDKHSEGIALNNLGIPLSAMHRVGDAIDAYRRAAAVFRETGDRQGAGRVLGNLGVALAELRAFDEAVDAFEQAGAIFREIGDRYTEGKVYGNLGALLCGMRRFREGAASWRRAQALFEALGAHEEAARIQGSLDALPAE